MYVCVPLRSLARSLSLDTLRIALFVKFRVSAEYLQAKCRCPRNCVNFSNKTESYKFAAGNIVREVPAPRRGGGKGLLTSGRTKLSE